MAKKTINIDEVIKNLCRARDLIFSEIDDGEWTIIIILWGDGDYRVKLQHGLKTQKNTQIVLNYYHSKRLYYLSIDDDFGNSKLFIPLWDEVI